MSEPTSRTVASGDIDLAVEEWGDRAQPTVVLVHGYPDTKAVWSQVAPRLAERIHVVAYDVRGAGASTAPADLDGYDLERLTDDLLAVVDAVSPGRPVHLVGHDWGSVQSWEFATAARSRDRIASYTTISGPSLDHVGHWVRARTRRPTPRSLARLLGQARRSWYVAAMRIPGGAERAWRKGGLAKRFPEFVHRAERVPGDLGHPAPTLAEDGANGAKLYRRNVGRRLSAPRADAVAPMPVQLIVPTRDRYLSAHLYDDLDRWAPNLRRRQLASHHWAPLEQPGAVTRWITEHIDDVESGHHASPDAAARRTFAGDARAFAGRLVLVTGAGSGIGRQTALAFAAEGAAVVLVDRDGSSVAETAVLAERIGATARPFTVDVTDAAAMDDLAERVVAEIGVVDVLVNNAGIGVAGTFLDTPLEDWHRVIDVNLFGVIHGCRSFARPMVDRGEGGHIVNVASAAAFQPSKVLPAYSASKAAVLCLSECLRAELADSGIGVTCICPGIVDTNITRTTTFVGKTAEEQAELRGEAARLYGRRGYGPEKVAARIVAAVRKDRAVVPVTPEASAAHIASKVAPGLLRRLARVDLTP